MPSAFPVCLRLGRGADRLLDDEPRGRPALFLDRDGVIVVDRDYLAAPEDVVLLPGVAAAIARANRADVPVVVVSNQSGVGRGYFGWDAVARVEERMGALLAAEGAALDLVLDAGAAPSATEGASYRKPGVGLFVLARRVGALDLAASWMVGDKGSDLEAASAAGLAGGVFVPGKAGEALDPARAFPGGFAARAAPTAARAVELGLDLVLSRPARPA